MLYLYGEQNKGLPEQWFTTTVLLRDIAVVVLCLLVIRQIYRPELDLVRWNGRVDDPAAGRSTGRPTTRRGGYRTRLRRGRLQPARSTDRPRLRRSGRVALTPPAIDAEVPAQFRELACQGRLL